MNKENIQERTIEFLVKKLQTAKEENEKLNKLHAFLHNKFNWSKEDVWIRNYLSSYIFDEEMVSDGKEYISPMKQISDLTQQNKQMREFIEKLYTVADDGQNMIKKHNDYNGKIYGLGYLQDIKDRIYKSLVIVHL